MRKKQSLIPVQSIDNSIYVIRGHKVMLDEDLAKLYGVETKILNQAVKRNLDRFPDEFMFQLTLKEARSLISQIVTSNKTPSLCAFPALRSQFVTSKRGDRINKPKVLRSQIAISNRGGRTYRPYAFTEHGTVMLASVLRSKRAIQMSIEVVKAFVRLRQVLASQKNIVSQLAEVRSFMLKRANESDREFKKVWRAIEELAGAGEDESRQGIGFRGV